MENGPARCKAGPVKLLIIFIVIKIFKCAGSNSPLTITGVPCSFVVIPDLIQIQTKQEAEWIL